MQEGTSVKDAGGKQSDYKMGIGLTGWDKKNKDEAKP